MTLPTEEQHATAVKAALTTAQAAPYDLDDLKTLETLPAYYTEVTVSRRFVGDGLRASREPGIRAVRLGTRFVAKNITTAREMQKRTTDALEGVSLTVSGETTTPIEFESADVIAEDDGYWSGLTTWTYVV